MELEEPIAININKKRLTENLEQSLQILQTWFSPSFPIGSYSFSHGLEALIEDKLIANKKDIIDYLNCILFYKKVNFSQLFPFVLKVLTI